MSEFNIKDTSKLIREKKISPIEITKKVLNDIKDKNNKYKAYISVMEEYALKKAQELENSIYRGNYMGPLHGIPISIKDNIYVKDEFCTSGSQLFENFTPEYDANLIQRLKLNGAIIIGKTNLNEIAYSGSSAKSYFGTPLNPYNHNKTTGGSSSGSATSVAANLALGSIGTDTGGSLRIPSSFCGLVGMKPTKKIISTHGVVPLAPTLDHVGPMTKTVTDNQLLLNAMVTPKIKKERMYHNKKIKIGIPSDYYFDSLQEEVQNSMSEAINNLLKEGIKVKEIPIKFSQKVAESQRVIMSTEAYVSFQKELQSESDKMGEVVKNRLLSAKKIKAIDYINALHIQKKAIEEYESIFDEVDILLTPTVSVLPTELGKRNIKLNDKENKNTQVFSKLVIPFNLIGFPALTVPISSQQGLPVGIQLIGKPYSEDILYDFGKHIESFYK